jgi:hypothetical protein
MCTLLCSALWLCRLCLREKQRDFSRQNLITIFFSFSPLLFLAVVADVVLCCDVVLCFYGVCILRVRKNRRRKWKVQKLQCCSCGGVRFFGFWFEAADRLAAILFPILCCFLCCASCILLFPPHGVLETCSRSRSVEEVDDKESLMPDRLLTNSLWDGGKGALGEKVQVAFISSCCDCWGGGGWRLIFFFSFIWHVEGGRERDIFFFNFVFSLWSG